jgi:hypothetical protein
VNHFPSKLIFFSQCTAVQLRTKRYAPKMINSASSGDINELNKFLKNGRNINDVDAVKYCTFDVSCDCRRLRREEQLSLMRHIGAASRLSSI